MSTLGAIETKAYFVGKTLDDVMRDVVIEIDARGERIRPRKGDADEITGVLLEILNPRARLSRTETRGKIFSALGELCWYLAGTNRSEFITYYIHEYSRYVEDDQIFGGYGPRLFKWRGVNQVSTVTAALKRRDSRQAVIQVFDAHDISERHKDVPCTCTLQFLLRQNKLHLFANMRSNDVHFGLPHDVFCFTMLQEIIARSVGSELGTYKHAVGSLHRYIKDRGPAKRFLKEGYQPTRATMSAMPLGDPWAAIESLLEAEAAIRARAKFDDAKLNSLDPYWADLVRLLQIFGAKKAKDLGRVVTIREKLSTPGYVPFVDRVIRQMRASAPAGGSSAEQPGA